MGCGGGRLPIQVTFHFVKSHKVRSTLPFQAHDCLHTENRAQGVGRVADGKGSPRETGESRSWWARRRAHMARVRDAGASALVGVLLAALCACTEGRVVTPARTQKLFHTPYREKDSRHFDVSAPSRAPLAVFLARRAAKLLPACSLLFLIPLVPCAAGLVDGAVCRLRPQRRLRPTRRSASICPMRMVRSSRVSMPMTSFK